MVYSICMWYTFYFYLNIINVRINYNKYNKYKLVGYYKSLINLQVFLTSKYYYLMLLKKKKKTVMMLLF